MSQPEEFVKPAAAGTTDENLRGALKSLRTHLGLEVAFISEFADGRRVFRHVDSLSEQAPVKVGGSDPLDESFCQRVVDGRLPELIPDTQALPGSWARDKAAEFGIRCHVSVPVRMGDGSVYGTLCCFSAAPEPSLGDRDLAIMRAFADFAGKELGRKVEQERLRGEVASRVRALFAPDGLRTVLQPIVETGTGRVFGFEALTRFSSVPPRSPDQWFKDAAAAGLGEPLEMLAVAGALEALRQLPEPIYVGINVSAAHILSGAVARTLAGAPLGRVVLEITEHEPVADYAAFAAAIEPLRAGGMRLAIDDAGAGYSSFRHILGLAPDYIKLDMSLTRDIDRDRTRRALAGALARFAAETGSRIVAEGVETEAELATLRGFGVHKVQGYLVGRPQPVEDALALLATSEQ